MTLAALSFLNMSLADILDILVVAMLFFVALRWVKNSSAINIFIAIILLFAIRGVAIVLGMKLLSALLGAILDIGVIALVIIFQPEIRRFLFRLGSPSSLSSSPMLQKIYNMFGLTGEDLGDDAINEIVQACREMAEQKTGALIVLPRRDHLEHIVQTGDRVDARISKRLIMNIFFKNSPLHDGAMIIDEGKIVAARCTLPITDRKDIPPSLGMRHKSAIGMSEQSDADVVVVSEETGGISFIRGGVVTRIKVINELRLLLDGKDGRNDNTDIK